MRSVYLLGGAAVTSLFNWFYIEPITTKLMFERYIFFPTSRSFLSSQKHTRCLTRYDLENLPVKTEEVQAKIKVTHCCSAP